MAASDKISGYNPSTRTILKDTDRLDISEDDGVGGFDTVYKVASDLKPIVAQKLSFDCASGSEGTVSMDWNCSGKFTVAREALIRIKVSGKSVSGIIIKIGSTSGAGDIMSDYELIGGGLDIAFPVPLAGAKPGILSDSGTYFLTLVSGANSCECDVFLYGHHEDV